MKPEDLKRFELLAEFGCDDRTELCELLESRKIAEGKLLFREGEEANALYLVVSGTVRINSKRAGALGLLCEGANLGAISLVAVGRREATAVAETDASVLVLTRAGFHRLAEDAPRTACRLAEAIIVYLAAGLRVQLPHIKQQFSCNEVVLSG